MQSLPSKKYKNRVSSLPRPKNLNKPLFPRTLSVEKPLRKVSENTEKQRKFSKKTSFKELFVQADLKKSQSFEENPEKMPETGLFIMKPTAKMPLGKRPLINQIKRDFEKNLINDESHDFERLSYFYRNRLASLLKTLGFQKYYSKSKTLTKNSILAKKPVFRDCFLRKP